MMRSSEWPIEQLDSCFRRNDGKGCCNKAQALGRIANACLEQAEARAFAEYEKFKGGLINSSSRRRPGSSYLIFLDSRPGSSPGQALHRNDDCQFNLAFLNKTRRIESDFDRVVKEIEKNKPEGEK